MQFDRRVAGRRMVNAGSVGMPYADQPGAYWVKGGNKRFRISGCPRVDVVETS
jgi:hypothetical protein